MLGYVDSYYKSQMNRFLKLKDDLVNEDIKVLERVLYTLNTAKTYKIQNRFLNFWSALEYTLYPDVYKRQKLRSDKSEFDSNRD